jgi:hypothetical protein
MSLKSRQTSMFGSQLKENISLSFSAATPFMGAIGTNCPIVVAEHDEFAAHFAHPDKPLSPYTGDTDNDDIK